MQRKVGWICTIPLLLIPASGSLAAQTQPCPQADVETEVGAVLAALDRAQNAGDLDAFLELVDDDVVYMPPDAPSIEGKAAVSNFYRALFEATDLHIRHASEQTVAAGPLVINRGRAVGTARRGSGGPWAPFDNRYVYVLRRGEDGRLRFIWVMYNAGPATGGKSR